MNKVCIEGKSQKNLRILKYMKRSVHIPEALSGLFIFMWLTFMDFYIG
jgi:hypothetical protein